MILLPAVAVVGVLVGVVGVGGVLLAPALVALGGLDAHDAAATSLCCLAPCGLVCAIQHRRATARGGSSDVLDVRLTPGLHAGALLGALVGAWGTRFVPGELLVAGMALLAAVTGLRMLRTADSAEAGRHLAAIGTPTASAVGALAGVGSSMTGTSGPVLLVPLLMLLRVATAHAVAVSQSAQVVVAPAGVLGFLPTTHLELWTVLPLAAIATLGTWAGLVLVSRRPELQHPRWVGIVLSVAAVLLGVRVAS